MESWNAGGVGLGEEMDGNKGSQISAARSFNGAGMTRRSHPGCAGCGGYVSGTTTRYATEVPKGKDSRGVRIGERQFK